MASPVKGEGDKGSKVKGQEVKERKVKDERAFTESEYYKRALRLFRDTK